ncbi:MAG: putative alpha/beta-fold hydrolase [Candidatus Paceibacteria bacterium]|jgi:predicted alpha/beta-fold hydrolase
MRFRPKPYGTACTPPFWARGGHSQTILAHIIPTAARGLDAADPNVRSLDIALGDGDQLRAYYAPGTSGTLVAAFHGLSGNSTSDYMRLAMASARRAGHSLLAVNHRGCGTGRGLARGLYHSGRGDDLGAVFAFARRELNEPRILAVGYSLSGNALLHLLSDESAKERWPAGALAINPPIDLHSCSEHISSGLSRIYDLRFVRRCLGILREREEDGLLPAGYVIPRPRTLREFDDLVTAPLSGFLNADDYYARCSTAGRLARIERPTVIVHSQDDPFVTAQTFLQADLSPMIHLHLEQHGGHVGYLTKRAPQQGLGIKNAEKWLGGALDHYLGELMKALD